MGVANDLQGQYNSVDDFLHEDRSESTILPQKAPTPPPAKTYGSVDELLNEGTTPPSSFAQTVHSVGNVMKAFGTGVSESYQDLGLSEENKDHLAKAGLFNDYKDNHTSFLGSLNEAIIKPAAVGLDALLRTPTAPFEGVASAVEQYGKETGETGKGTQTAQDIRLLPEFLMGQSGSFHLPEPIARARSDAVIGEGEGGYLGTKTPTPEELSGREKAAAAIPPEPEAPKDIHTVAREIAPDTFKTYDALGEQQEQLRTQLNTLAEQREKDATSPFDADIADLQAKVQDAKDRGKDTVYSDILDKRMAEREDALQVSRSQDTEEMARVRQEIQEADYKRRDLAPAVSAAYREAQSRIPVEEPKAPEETPPVEATKTEEAAQTQRSFIADDVSKKLQSAGRPGEEADAAAQLVAAHYEARSERFGGAKGTAQEMYEKEGANIESAAKKDRGTIRFGDAKATIRLLKNANASTFIHETGHQWLDELLRDAKDEAAPSGLTKDAKTVRTWLGVGDDVSLRETDAKGRFVYKNEHEKFARGFERYVMEGVAPSKELAGVFAKFKQWLTQIYQTVQRLRSPISGDIRDVFDRFLSANPERTVIAPERETIPPEPVAPPQESVPTSPETAKTSAPADSTAAGAQKEPDAAKIAEATAPEATKAKPVEPPAAPQQQYKSPETALVDKAGNIRLDKLNTTDDVKEAIRQVTEKNGDFMEARRGVVPHADTFALAESMGLNVSDVAKRVKGQALSAHELKAYQQLMVKLTNDAVEKSKLEKTPENIMAFAEAQQRALMVTEQFSAGVAEAGRALNILQTMSGEAKEAQNIAELFQKMTGKTPEEIGRQMDFLSKLDTPEQAARFLQVTKKPTFKDQMLEYYVNCLISGPLTHMRYAVGNAVKAITTPLLEIPAAATYGAVRGAITGEKPGIYYGEAVAQLYAFGKGSREGLRAAAEAFSTGNSPFLPGEVQKEFYPKAIPGVVGKVINIPSRSVSAIHSFFKSLRYEQNIQGLAYRTARDEGLEGDALSRRIAQLTRDPSEDMMQSATKDALKELFMAPTDYNSTMGALTQFTNRNVLAKIIVPFMKIGTQITREAFVERTPLGLFSDEVRNNALGRNGAAARDMQIGKMAFGTALMGATSMMVSEGVATGDGPSDPKKKAAWLRTHRPNTITIGDISLSYQGLGALGMLMRFSANMTETANAWGDEDGLALGRSFVEGMTRSVLDDTWMRGVKDLLDAVYHPDEYGSRYIQQFATNWLPFSVGLGQIDRKTDDYQRMVRSHGLENGFGILDEARSKISGFSEELPPRRDVFGEPMRWGGNVEKYKDDPVMQRLDALQIFPGKLQQKIRGVQLTDQQYDDYSRTAGKLVKMRLDSLVSMPGFSQLQPSTQVDMIKNNIELYREQARSVILMQNPDIMDKARQQKRKDMQ